MHILPERSEAEIEGDEVLAEEIAFEEATEAEA